MWIISFLNSYKFINIKFPRLFLHMEMFNRIGKRGSQGIGTLIIFIALILVAAVAAGVIIQTGNSLQSKAYSVGSQTQSKLVTFLETDAIIAQDTSDGAINASNDTFTLSLRVGTEITDINLDDLTIQMFTKDGVQALEYSGAANNSITQFGVVYRSNSGVPKLDGYITAEDIVEVTFLSQFNISEKDRVSIRYSPRDGQTLGVDFIVPSALTDTVVRLYP